MSKPELYAGIGSLLMGVLFAAVPGIIGRRFSRIEKSVWKGHEEDLPGRIKQKMDRALPAFSRSHNNDAKTKKVFRILGFVFMIQAIVFFILSGVMKQ